MCIAAGVGGVFPSGRGGPQAHELGAGGGQGDRVGGGEGAGLIGELRDDRRVFALSLGLEREQAETVGVHRVGHMLNGDEL